LWGSFNQSGCKQEGDDPENLMGAVVSLLASIGVNKIVVSKHMPNLMDLLTDFQGTLLITKIFISPLKTSR
jgi:hypothetical protein